MPSTLSRDWLMARGIDANTLEMAGQRAPRETKAALQSIAAALQRIARSNAQLESAVRDVQQLGNPQRPIRTLRG